MANGKATDKQRALVTNIINGATVADAARRAGYGHIETGYVALRSPTVQNLLRKEMEHRLLDDATAARSLLRRFVDDEDAPGKIRLDAAKTLLDRAGFTGQQVAKQGEAKDIHELSQDELRERIGRLEGELSERSRTVIDGNDASTDGQAADFLE